MSRNVWNAQLLLAQSIMYDMNTVAVWAKLNMECNVFMSDQEIFPKLVIDDVINAPIKELSMLKIRDIYEANVLEFVYKCLNELRSQTFRSHFQMGNEFHDRDLRNMDRLHVPACWYNSSHPECYLGYWDISLEQFSWRNKKLKHYNLSDK